MTARSTRPVFRLFRFIMIVLLAMAVLPVSPAAAASSGPNYPTNTTTSGGTGDAWLNPGNANADDNANAIANVEDNRSSETLQARGFNFAIPVGATINGITVEIGRSSESDNSGSGNNNRRISDEIVQLVKAGTAVGTDKGIEGTDWPTSEAIASYGGAADLWGTTWTRDQINASNFGVNLVVQNNNNRNFLEARVDYIRVTVEYTLPATATTLVVSSVTGVYGDTATLSATLTTTAGSLPVAGRTVAFTLNGVAACSDATDAAGLATCDAPLTVDVGSYPTGVAASHAVGGGYAASSDTDSLTVTARPITLTAVTDTKVYDGTTASSVAPILTGSLAPADVATFSQSFDTKDVGTGKTITPAVVFTTGKASNYDITLTPVTDGVITARPITVTAVTDTKVYDATTASSGTPVLTGTLAAGDTATYSQAFATADAGTGKTINPAVVFTVGSASNYDITLTPATDGVITARPITITAVTAIKVYDGTTTSDGVPTLTAGTLAGSDAATYSQTYDTKDVGTNKTLTPAVTFTSGSASNYDVTLTPATDGAITPLAITVSAVDAAKTKNTADPVLTYTVTPPLVIGDVFTGALQRQPGEEIGTYPILQGDLSAGPNYTITFEPGLFTINDLPGQTITILTHAPAQAQVGSSFTVEATASSGLPVTYSASGVCYNVGSVFTITAEGTCQVYYSQSGSASYNPAPTLSEVVEGTAIPEPPVIKFYLPMLSR